MANFFCSVGYSAENVHSGMIAYLCDLWNEGEREPLGSFLDSLGVPLETENDLRADLEWKRIDLVVRDAQDGSFVVAVEMKVDSHEGLTPSREPQTISYPKLIEGAPLMFVTLGAGEFYHPPVGQSEKVKWVRLRDFHEALEAISKDDPFIEGWRNTVANEVDLQDRCFSRDRSRIEEYRGKTWNLYFLGYLKKKLTGSLSDRDIGINTFVYTAGSGPDTILYFGRSKLPAYLEINQNGRLNLKVNLAKLKTEQKETRLSDAEDYYRNLLEDYHPDLNTRKLDTQRKSRTVMSFDIGLDKSSGNFFYRSGRAETISKLIPVLETFYGSPPFTRQDLIDLDPEGKHPPLGN